MAKFRSVEDRVYPDLGLTLNAGDVVELPEDTNVAGLVKHADKSESKAQPAPVEKVGE